MPNRTDIILLKTHEQIGDNMKKNIFLPIFISVSLLCGCSENHSLTKGDMAIFDRCTLFYRGIDDNGYIKYALMVTDSLTQDFFFLNAWYKDTSNYRLYVMDSVKVDTTFVLSVLSTANQYKIREIHPIIGEHAFYIYFYRESEPILIHLDR